MISIICPVTNNEILKMLLNSIKKQDYTNYELIILDSKELNFKSASQTLNYGVSKASGDILLFCHLLNMVLQYCNNKIVPVF